MDNWDEVRTAYQVARLGTVSGAAEVLGVHHATVIRHIDALEARLGVKLFQRHARGYTATEAGTDLSRVAQATEDQFNQLVGRLKGQGESMTGELVITSLESLAPLMVPALAEFQEQHRDLTVRYLTGERLFRLEYGEAHVAIRAGNAPEQPDNVVQPFAQQRMAIYAAQSYADRHGLPKGPEDFAGHRFVGHDDDKFRAPHARWMRAHAPHATVIFRSTDFRALEEAIASGTGIGFIPCYEAARRGGLIEVMPSVPEWSAPLWLVTHVDLHRTHKVQTFQTFLKQRAKDWGL
ncbi:LysR family transcriptional regulator [Marinibacterium profundimaris]|uniref:LysR family transcriptional regulator n=1 Tax=Marinibacterium profundimaris TaxID=1679460 RepID=A0A225NMC5_9RHOB|nr:LysR family transcriptional regulator [Marinibacterium profundimaris]OWU71688.1 LysR family transcriptional regulator [Marinibacterium profundimaris]